jgi:hypothetical protein
MMLMLMIMISNRRHLQLKVNLVFSIKEIPKQWVVQRICGNV